jgi:hypothetical protein
VEKAQGVRERRKEIDRYRSVVFVVVQADVERSRVLRRRRRRVREEAFLFSTR